MLCKMQKAKIPLIIGIATTIFLFSLLSSRSIFAAGTTLKTSPNSGTYSSSFVVDVVVDGGGQAFNAAQATVSISPNLSVSDLVLGDCKFSYLATPSIANPSFGGVILGSSSKKCTVYSLTLVPIEKGTASITLTNASIKRFGDAANILSTIQNGSYILTAGNRVATPSAPPSQEDLYTVVLKIQDNNNALIKTTQVTLRPAGDNSPLQAKTDTSGTVQFINVEPGIFILTVANYDGENVLNVAGNNRTLVLGVKVNAKDRLSKSLSNPMFIGVALIAGIISGGIIFGLIKHFKKK